MARIDLSENEFMEKFVSQDHIDSNDVQFWYQLLSCSFDFMRVQNPKIVDKMLDPYLVQLTLNNSESLNIGSLVRVALDRASRIKTQNGQSTNPYYIYQSFNALYLLRCICKSYIENLSEERLVQSFRSKVDIAESVPQQPLQPLEPPKHLQTSSNQPDLRPPLVASQQAQQSSDPNLVNGSVLLNQVSPAPEQPVQAQQQSANLPPVPEKSPSSQNVSTPASVASTPKKTDVTSGSVMFDQYLAALIEIIVDIPQNDSTYLLQVEAINSLLVLLSVQMYISTPASQLNIYKSLMQKKCSIHALILTKTLLTNFIRQQPVPQESGSIIIGLASGLWRVLTLGYSAQEEEDAENMPLLAKQSLLLLNILTNHYSAEKNPYREAIVSCRDSKFNLLDPQSAIDDANNDALTTAMTSKSALIANSIKIEFSELFETICKHLANDQVALLLYILLHSNEIFRPYILTTKSSDLSNLVMPLLNILYSSIEKGSHHVYMVVIIFIILSEEAAFNQAIYRIPVRGVPWYKDRILSDLSLGSLTTLIVTRSFQYNTFRIKDKFLHSNLYATLANLSNYFHQLHPYVCQRLIELLERLSKRYFLLTKPALTKHLPPTPSFLSSLDNPLARALATDSLKQDAISTDSSSIELNNPPESQANGASSTINIDIPNQSQQQSSLVTNGNGSSNNNNVVLPPVDMHGNGHFPKDSAGQQSPTSNSSNADHINISIDDSRQDLDQLEEVIKMILSVINNSLAMQLEHNPDLIYTLLYKRHVFSQHLLGQQSFYDMVINVERILTYFYEKIESFQRPLAVEEIKELIQKSSRELDYKPQDSNANDRLQFHYVEDDQPEEFFIPYIWTRIYYSSGIFWNPKHIVLFNPEDL